MCSISLFKNYQCSLVVVNSSVKTEAFGGTTGVSFEETSSSKITNIEIRAGMYLDAVNVTRQDGTVVKHGGNGGTLHSFHLDNDEYICKIELGYSKFIDQLTFFTTKDRKYGPYGRTTGRLKTIDFGKGVLCGFLGRSGAYVDAIGFIFDTLP